MGGPERWPGGYEHLLHLKSTGAQPPPTTSGDSQARVTPTSGDPTPLLDSESIPIHMHKHTKDTQNVNIIAKSL